MHILHNGDAVYSLPAAVEVEEEDSSVSRQEECELCEELNDSNVGNAAGKRPRRLVLNQPVGIAAGCTYFWANRQCVWTNIFLSNYNTVIAWVVMFQYAWG